MRIDRYLKGPSCSDLKHSNAFKMASKKGRIPGPILFAWVALAILGVTIGCSLGPILSNARALEQDRREHTK